MFYQKRLKLLVFNQFETYNRLLRETYHQVVLKVKVIIKCIEKYVFYVNHKFYIFKDLCLKMYRIFSALPPAARASPQTLPLMTFILKTAPPKI